MKVVVPALRRRLLRLPIRNYESDLHGYHDFPRQLRAHRCPEFPCEPTSKRNKSNTSSSRIRKVLLLDSGKRRNVNRNSSQNNLPPCYHIWSIASSAPIPSHSLCNSGLGHFSSRTHLLPCTCVFFIFLVIFGLGGKGEKRLESSFFIFEHKTESEL